MRTFFGQFFSNFKTTGAILPSGGFLARRMTRPARKADGPMRILEIGPGTGAFTRHLLRNLQSGDELHIVEINTTFAEYLESRLLKTFRRENPDIQVHLHCASIEEAPIDGVFDYIVCGLPFNNFPVSLVRQIFRRMMSLLADGGKLTFFEYAGVRALKAPMVGSRGREQMKRHAATMKVLVRRHRGQRDFVLVNMPPAYAHQLTR
ncbi:MAG: SAM-dependent methyltransferase [Planctomycetota bacterium]|nr:SAM-dependent methyltransferase [Planctomycetota bacterium]